METKMIRAAIAVICVVAAAPLSAATYTWTGGGTPDGSGAYAWNDVDNWGGSGYPVENDAAVLNSSQGCTIVVPSGGAKLYRIYAEAGEWRMTGGTLEITDAAPFSTGVAVFDKRAAIITFDCPVKFSSTADKTILSGNIFNNTVTLGTAGRAFFMKGDVSGTSGLTVFSGPRTYTFTGNNNICCGKNDSNAAHGGEMWIKDGATVQAKIFFDFVGSTVTVTNGTLTTSASGTSQSIDVVGSAILNVLEGGTVTCAGKLDLGQGASLAPTLNIYGGTVSVNYFNFRVASGVVPSVNIDNDGTLTVTGNMDFKSGAHGTSINIGKGSLTVGGTMTQGSAQIINFTVPADQQLGSVAAGTMTPSAAGNKINIAISDDTLQNGTIYTLVTDRSKTLTLADYAVTYNNKSAAECGTLAVTDGVLTFQPTATAVVWTGAGDGVLFSDTANWNGGVVPFDGCSIYLDGAGGSVTNDLSGLVASRVQFQAGAGAFALGGNAITVNGSIVNRSGAEQTFNCAVAAPAGEEIYADYSSAGVVFAGGLTCDCLAGASDLSRTIKGQATFTRTQPEGDTDNDIWPTTTFTVAAGSSLAIPGELFVRESYGNPHFVIEQGATMSVGAYRSRSTFTTFDVKGTLDIGTAWSFGWTSVFTTADSTGTVNIGTLLTCANSPCTFSMSRANIGAGGVTGASTPITPVASVCGLRLNGTTLGATSDWSFQAAEGETLPKFALEIPDAAALDTDGYVVSLRAPLTGGGTLALSDDTILDVSALPSCAVTLAPAAGAAIQTDLSQTLALPLALPTSGQVVIRIASASPIPTGSTFPLFYVTGLSAADAARFAVTVPGQPSVAGDVTISDGLLSFTVTASAASPASLLWRPTDAAEAVWSSDVAAWENAATSARSPWIGFADATFDGAETFADGTVSVTGRVSVSDVTVDGARDYTFTGEGTLVGHGTLVKSGTGTLTLDGPALTGQDIVVSNGTLKLGANLPVNGLGNSGTNGNVVVANGGQIDLNYTSDTSNIAARNSLLADSLVHVAGAGPDGEGAIVNRGGSTTWYAALGRVELDGDTTFGGVSRIDFRGGGNYPGTTYAGRPYLHGPDFTVTSKVVPVGGNYGLFFSSADVEVSNIVVEAGAAIGSEGVTVFNAPGGIELKDGAHFDAFGNTVTNGASGTMLKVGDGASGTLRNMTGTATFWPAVDVAEGGTLSISGNTLNLQSAVTNEGEVVFAGGTQNVMAPLVGDGTWKQTAGNVNIHTGDVPTDFTWNQDGGTLQFFAGAQLGAKTPTVVQKAGAIVTWGNYETSVNPTMGALSLSGGGSFYVCTAISQDMPRIDIVNGATGHFFTDNLETHTRFLTGDWQCNEFIVGGGTRGGHTTAYEGTRVRTAQFAVGNQAYTAPRAIYSLEGGTLEVGAPGGNKDMRSQYAPLGTFAFFNNGTLRLNDGFEAEWGFIGVFGRDSADSLTVDVGAGTAYYRSGLGGKASVTLTGTGNFFTTQPFANADLVQDYAEGHWSVGAVTNDLTGASAFGDGLSVADGAFVRVCIRNDELCEWAHYGTSDWMSLYTNGCNAAWRIANNMNHLHSNLNSSAKAYSNHSFVYRGQFYVEETGTWTFAGTYDDRLAFVVDGKAVFSTTSASDIKYGSCELSQGWHDYFIVAEDNTGTQGPTAWSGMALGWTNAVVTSTALASYSKFAIGEPGLRFRLANSVQWERKSVAGDDWPTTEDYDTITVTNSLRQLGQYSKWGPGKSAANRFSGSFYVSAEQAGEWYFWGTYDDQIRFKVDGVDSGMNGRKDGVQYATTRYNLAEGWHSFEMRTYDNTGNWGPWDGSCDYALGVQITPEGGSAGERLAFDERNFRFTRLERPAYAGIHGELSLGAGSTLVNGAGGAGWCPIWGTLKGSGTLSGTFRFAGDHNSWEATCTGNARDLAAATFANATPATFQGLKNVKVTFDGRPTRRLYYITGVINGLMSEDVSGATVTATDGSRDYSENFTLTVKDGRLAITNLKPGGTFIIVK